MLNYCLHDLKLALALGLIDPGTENSRGRPGIHIMHDEEKKTAVSAVAKTSTAR